MGILDRASRLIRSNINDLIARAEDPEKMLTQILEDMRRQLAELKTEVAKAVAEERRLKRHVNDEKKNAALWERRARLAINQGNDDLARQALTRGQEHATQATGLEEQWVVQHKGTEELRKSLMQLNNRIEEAKRKKNLLVAKAKRAEAQKRIHDTMQGIESKSAFRAFEDLTARIDEKERLAAASMDISRELSGDSLEDEFLALEAGGEAAVEDKLMLLKMEMGLLTDGGEEAEAPRALEAAEASADSSEDDAGAAESGDADAAEPGDADAAESGVPEDASDGSAEAGAKNLPDPGAAAGG